MCSAAALSDELITLTSSALLSGYRARVFSPSEVIAAAFDRIASTADKYNAFITVCEEHARRAAAELDRIVIHEPDRVVAGFGIPLTVKDITATAGIRTTRGAYRTATWVPDFDAEAVRRLRVRGSIIIGKTNTSETAWKAEGSNPTFGASLNPWAPSLTAGGSSGGAGVATAMRYGTWATGTDGFGSIRVPASFCHVVGFKPTLGSVPYYPVSAEFLSHIGPLTRTVDDARQAYTLMRGPLSQDPLSQRPAIAESPARRLRIGVVRQVDSDPVDAPILSALNEFCAWLTNNDGHVVEPVTLPADGGDIIRPILMAFSASELAGDSDEDLARRDHDLVRLAASARDLSALELAVAQERRIGYLHQAQTLFEQFDFIISPTVSRLPFPAGGHSPTPYDDDVSDWCRWCSMTYPWNLAGNPALSIPWSRSVDGLPISMQIVGRHGHDLDVLALGATLEEQHPWHWVYAGL